jgi:hypothetical protein
MPTIRIDDQVFQRLQEEAMPLVDTPNSVLRRLLRMDDVAPTTGPDRKSGELLPLLKAGTLRPNEALIWRRRTGTYKAMVTLDGWIRLEDGSEKGTPTGAARLISGYEVNGWRQWRRERDNVLLDELR